MILSFQLIRNVIKLKALESTGLRPTSDPRLKEMVQNIQKYQNQIETTQDITELVIGRSEFKE